MMSYSAKKDIALHTLKLARPIVKISVHENKHHRGTLET